MELTLIAGLLIAILNAVFINFFDNRIIKNVLKNSNNDIFISKLKEFLEFYASVSEVDVAVRISKILISEFSGKMKKDENQRKSAPTVVGLYAIKKSKRNLHTSIVLAISLVVYEGFVYLFQYPFLNIPFLIITLLLLLVAIDEIILSYRVTKGYFGTNASEAKEIIDYIRKNASENNNFRDPNGNIKIFDKTIKDVVDEKRGFSTGLNPISI